MTTFGGIVSSVRQKPTMKPTKTVILTVSVLACTTALSRGQGLELDFGNLSGTAVQFNGNLDTFNFTTNGGGFQWTINADTGGTGSALGLSGAITGGPFNYGPITVSGSSQSATVLGPLGDLVISDGSHNLTGQVNWLNVSTLGLLVGGFNVNLAINLSDVVYTGNNPDLETLVYNQNFYGQDGTLDLTFSFVPGKTLTQLSTGAGPYDASFSGSIFSVPEPAPLELAALGGLSLLLYRRWK